MAICYGDLVAREKAGSDQVQEASDRNAKQLTLYIYLVMTNKGRYLNGLPLTDSETPVEYKQFTEMLFFHQNHH